MKLSRGFFVALFLITGATFALTYSSLSQTTGCSYYASPTGGGNGTSMPSPFKISNFWSVAGPGKTLCLLDGTYTGADSMINPPQNLNGTAGAPITITALNEGKVLIKGQGSNVPVKLYYNNWFVIQGLNACCSSETVVTISKSNNNIVRRVAAWDAADNNTSIFGIHWATYNLLEDVAGWGVARKIYESSQAGDFTTIRRAWGRWQRSTVTGPKMTYTLAYNNYNMLCENCIGTWSGESMPQQYVLMSYNNTPWTGNGAGTYTNYGVQFPYGIFSVDAIDPANAKTNSKILGSIAYVRSTDRFPAEMVMFLADIDGFETNNTVAHIEPGSYTSVQPFGLFGMSGTAAKSLAAKNLTAVGGRASYYNSQWITSNVVSSSSAQNIFAPTQGAKVCYRYQDGALTSQPLWPWPMDQRIKDAMVISGYKSVTAGMSTDNGLVTSAIEQMFGQIPASCKGSSTTPDIPLVPPSAPTNLQVQLEVGSANSGATGPKLSVTPTSVSTNGTIAITWNGIANPSSTDWIGLYAPGASDTNWIDWMYVSCSKSAANPISSGSCSYALPSIAIANNYELRLLSNDTFTRLTVSNPFSISAAITVSSAQ